MADNHFVIEKKSMEESTVTAIAEIRGDAILDELARMPVSYTHLDVYKRQGRRRPFELCL